MQNGVVKTDHLRLAVIGLGARAAHMARMVCEADPGVRITAVVDPRGVDAIDSAGKLGFPGTENPQLLYGIDDVIDHADQFDGVMIGTPCHLHSPTAVQIADLGLPVFLEKPVATSWSQLRELEAAYAGREESVVVSFPLRLTDHVRCAVDIIRSGRLGTINQVQAVNNVPYGGVYFGQWYRDYDKAGGLWLQKATHDFDYINHLMAAASPGVRPVAVTAMHSRTVYGGSLPADLRCSVCERAADCAESPQNLTIRGSDGGILNYEKPSLASDHACAFSRSIKNQDAGSAIIMYSNGVHAAYSQNFITRGSAGRRGATVIGYEATLQFDWNSDSVTVIDHHRTQVDQIKVQSQGTHGGGDAALARNFVDLLRRKSISLSTLREGIVSAAMCLGAREAAETGIAYNLPSSHETIELNIRPRGPVEPATPDKVPAPQVAVYVSKRTKRHVAH